MAALVLLGAILGYAEIVSRPVCDRVVLLAESVEHCAVRSDARAVQVLRERD